MRRSNGAVEVVTVTMNPAIDQTLNIPRFTAGAVNRVLDSHLAAGGKGVNVAARLAAAGRRVAVTGFLGRDNANIFETCFASLKIEDRFLRLPGETRVGIKIADAALGSTTDINFPGLAPSSDALEGLRAVIEALDAEWFVLAGSVPPGVPLNIYRDLIASLRARGKKVAVDTSGDALRLALEAGPHLFKPNVHELEQLLDVSLDGEEAVLSAARTLVARGIEQVVVSMGERGACFVTADGAVIARPPNIELASTTVGAGDAMVAGVIAAALDRLPLDELAKTATAHSLEALAAQKRGIAAWKECVAIA